MTSGIFGIPLPGFAGQVLFDWITAAIEALGLRLLASLSSGLAATLVAGSIAVVGLFLVRRRLIGKRP
ncbi:hypothetical protein [Phreatobacter stygius]|uniref:Uncharacterized protein n=1 Tax=Phreatobacter stygius TaxID=1940610 RepID=A0A4D7BEC6_9HYPH|nr:hypothetical protein [Phreatobacter stygius]QCI66287.1 hypothetical protein E8M01_19945 [Phreatobacter stygius]